MTTKSNRKHNTSWDHHITWMLAYRNGLADMRREYGLRRHHLEILMAASVLYDKQEVFRISELIPLLPTIDRTRLYRLFKELRDVNKCFDIDETGMNTWELRMQDTRLGRWFAPDLYDQFHSTYLSMGNNPISFVDPDGGYSIFVGADGFNDDGKTFNGGATGIGNQDPFASGLSFSLPSNSGVGINLATGYEWILINDYSFDFGFNQHYSNIDDFSWNQNVSAQINFDKNVFKKAKEVIFELRNDHVEIGDMISREQTSLYRNGKLEEKASDGNDGVSRVFRTKQPFKSNNFSVKKTLSIGSKEAYLKSIEGSMLDQGSAIFFEAPKRKMKIWKKVKASRGFFEEIWNNRPRPPKIRY